MDSSMHPSHRRPSEAKNFAWRLAMCSRFSPLWCKAAGQQRPSCLRDCTGECTSNAPRNEEFFRRFPDTVDSPARKTRRPRESLESTRDDVWGELEEIRSELRIIRYTALVPITFDRSGPEEVNDASDSRVQAVRPTPPKLICKLRGSLERDLSSRPSRSNQKSFLQRPPQRCLHRRLWLSAQKVFRERSTYPQVRSSTVDE